MHTYEIVALSDENGKTYESKYGTYSKETGFKLNEKAFLTWKDVEIFVNRLLHEDCWKLKIEKKKMTKEDIEKALGYEIDIVDKDGSYSFNDIYDFFNHVFKED